MSTIVIETRDDSSRRFEIDLANEPEEFVLEFRNFVSKLEAKSKPVRKNGTKRLSAKLRRASAYIDSIADRPESKAALAEADAIRKSWIRKHD
jgi:hypothetical protein